MKFIDKKIIFFINCGNNSFGKEKRIEYSLFFYLVLVKFVVDNIFNFVDEDLYVCLGNIIFLLEVILGC